MLIEFCKTNNGENKPPMAPTSEKRRKKMNELAET
jgi:hypothetical protein